MGSGQDLLFLINEILDLSKVEAGMMEVHMEEVPLETVVDSCAVSSKGWQKEKGLAFESSQGPEVPPIHPYRQTTARTDPEEPSLQRIQIHEGRHRNP
jgi:signal transduction histidine kinase